MDGAGVVRLTIKSNAGGEPTDAYRTVGSTVASVVRRRRQTLETVHWRAATLEKFD